MAFFCKIGLRALVTSGLSVLCASMAHGFVTYHTTERAKSASSAYVPSRVTVDTQALFADGSTEQSKSAKSLTLQLPSGKRYNVTRARILPGLDGGKSFVGFFDSHGEDYRIYITETQGAISGVMLSPEGSMELSSLGNTSNGNAVLTSRTRASHLTAIHIGSDARRTTDPDTTQLFNQVAGENVISAEQLRDAKERAKAGAQVTIDLLIVYTSGMLSRHGNAAGVTSRLNTIVATLNDGLAQSQVNLTIRLVNATQVNYSDSTSVTQALADITRGSTNAIKSTIDSLRDQYTADLVSLVRPYTRATHQFCGYAEILGINSPAYDSTRAFSVVSDGNDTGGPVNGSTYFCPETTFAHEIGHNLGLEHDRINTSSNGATTFGRGYINTAAGFGTIMAAYNTRVARFSNPAINCNGVPCGISRTDTANSADSAGAILTTMDAIAGYRTAVVVDPNADSDGDGIPNGIEAAEGRQANVKDNAIFAGMATNSDRLFAMQQYRDFLGREADAAGLADWTFQLSSRALSREQVIKRFFDSQEFQNGVPAVVRLYLGYFKRIPDHAGLLGWVGAYRGGQSLKNISDAFSASQEFQQTYGALNNIQFVTLVYRNVLNRAPDQAGLDGWVTMLNSGASRGEVMTGFTESPEFRSNSGNSVEVIMMYEGMLRRAGETAGYSDWVNYLNAGNTSIPLISGFLNSVEYRNRFLP
jgi:Metallo-peptidase family M12B Reprolysin-like/Domain of unknown function (DUF4214)